MRRPNRAYLWAQPLSHLCTAYVESRVIFCHKFCILLEEECETTKSGSERHKFLISVFPAGVNCEIFLYCEQFLFMFVLKLQLPKLNVHKYGFENSYVKTVIKIPAVKTLEMENRYKKSFTPCLRCTGCSPPRTYLPLPAPPPLSAQSAHTRSPSA